MLINIKCDLLCSRYSRNKHQTIFTILIFQARAILSYKIDVITRLCLSKMLQFDWNEIKNKNTLHKRYKSIYFSITNKIVSELKSLFFFYKCFRSMYSVCCSAQYSALHPITFTCCSTIGRYYCLYKHYKTRQHRYTYKCGD